MDNSDKALQLAPPACGQTAVPVGPLAEATELIQKEAAETALGALEKALTAALAGGSPAGLALQTKALANEAVRAAEQMKQRLGAIEQPARMAG